MSIVRQVQPADLPFLWEMLGAAASPHGDPIPVDDLRSRPELAHYLEGWGRQGDAGVIAVDDGGTPLGACWYRLFSTSDAGYGFIDEATPELAIACVPEARGQGLGHQLIRSILDSAGERGHTRLSLSVLLTNTAGIKVYEDCGFDAIGLGRDGDDQIMVAST